MEPFFPPFFFLLFVVAIGEFILSAFWVPFYFRFGIPLYRQSFRLAETPPDLDLSIPQLEQQLPRNWWQSGVVFRRLGPYELAFRQKFNSRNPLHGRLQFDPLNQELSITGYFYWTLFLFPLFILTLAFVELFFLFFLVFMILIVLINVAQLRANYGRIGQAVQNIFPTKNWSDPSQNLPGLDVFPTSKTKADGLTSTELLMILILILMVVVTVATFTVVWLSRN